MRLHVFERSAFALAAIFGFGMALAMSLAEARGKPPPPPPPPPATPPGRAWHGFTGNGAVAPGDSRLYLYGGADSQPKALADLWYYMAYTGSWTLVTPNGSAKPGPRQWHGWSCGGGACLLADGSNGVGLVNETWYYAQAANAWTQVSCQRSACPSARQMVTSAYDPAGVHLLFGGRGSNAGLDDTWTFSPKTMTWKLQARQAAWPQERNRAGAASVPGFGIVLLGGQTYKGTAVLCDMFVWRNNGWVTMDSAGAPCLHSHSMAWDDRNQRLVVTGGYIDTSDTKNALTYYLPFTNGVAGQWSTDKDLSGCFASVHPGARMAFDAPTGRKVFFGGETNVNGSIVRYGDTTVCD